MAQTRITDDAEVAAPRPSEPPGAVPERAERFTVPERRRMLLALGVSLVAHALLLSLVFGGSGMGAPGLALPWQDRRAQADDLSIVLTPPPAPPTPHPAAPKAWALPLQRRP